MHRYCVELLAVIKQQGAKVAPTKAVRLLKDRLEHRRKIAGGRIDDLQHLGGRGLSSLRVVEPAIDLTLLCEQFVPLSGELSKLAP